MELHHSCFFYENIISSVAVQGPQKTELKAKSYVRYALAHVKRGVRKRKWGGKERESVSEDVLLRWTPPDPSRIPGSSILWDHPGDVKTYPLAPFPQWSKTGPTQHPLSTHHSAFQNKSWDFSHLLSSREALGQTGERHCLCPTEVGNRGCPKPRQNASQQKVRRKSSQGVWSEVRPTLFKVVPKRCLIGPPNILPPP